MIAAGTSHDRSRFGAFPLALSGWVSAIAGVLLKNGESQDCSFVGDFCFPTKRLQPALPSSERLRPSGRPSGDSFEAKATRILLDGIVLGGFTRCRPAKR